MFGKNEIPKEVLKNLKPKVRNFGGKTENFSDNRERHFYQRMLRHYLKGHTHFNFGFKTTMIGQRIPETYEVMVKYV